MRRRSRATGILQGAQMHSVRATGVLNPTRSRGISLTAFGVALLTLTLTLVHSVTPSWASFNQSQNVVGNSFTTLSVPSVTNLTVTQSGRTANLILNWTPASLSTGYTIYEGNPDPVSGSCPTTVTYYLVATLTDPNANTYTDSNRIGNNMPPGYPTFSTYCYQVYTLYGGWASSPASAVIKVAIIRGPMPAGSSVLNSTEASATAAGIVQSVPTQTASPTRTTSASATRPSTARPTASATLTLTVVAKPSATATATVTPKSSATATSSPVTRPSPTRTVAGSPTPASSTTRVSTATRTATPGPTATSTYAPSGTATAIATPNVTTATPVQPPSATRLLIPGSPTAPNVGSNMTPVARTPTAVTTPGAASTRAGPRN